MNIIGINTLVYMDALRDGATQSELLGSIAELGVTLAEVRREYIAGDDEFNAIANAARINGGCSIPFRNPSRSTVTSIPDSKSSLMKRNVWAHPM